MFPDASSPDSERPEGDASAPARKVLSLSASARERATDGPRKRPTVRPAGRARNPVVREPAPQGERGPRNDRPDRGDRGERPARGGWNDRPRRDADQGAGREVRAERPPRRDRFEEGGRQERGARPERGARSEGPRAPRGEGRFGQDRRDSRDSRMARGPRPERREDRPWGGDRNERPERAARGDREMRGPARREGARPEQRERVRRDPLPPAVPTASAGLRPYVPGTRAGVPSRDPSEGIRLNKRLSDMGLCSRREADEWIARGWVRVNGQEAVMGQLVQAQDRVTVDERAKGQQAQQVTILLNKPVGYVSGQAEDGYRPAASLIEERTRWREDPSRQRFHPAQLKGLAPAGRLDIDSVGLLVLTQDGRVARQIIGEDSTVDKEYLVRVEYGQVTEDVQSVFPESKLALLRHGLSLDGEPLLPAQVDWQNPEQLRFVLTEGKKRQIRRMCEAVGLRVVGLKRIRIGQVVLGNLPTGQWRYLLPHEQF